LASELIETMFSGEPNLSTTERVLYVGLGLGIAAAGAQPRPNPILNILALAAGSYLAWSGYQGRCPVKALIFKDGERKKLAAQHPESTN
jgi:threonine/homoserine/homoserine lactone efflux protein